jgi:hypothetical protein
MLEAVGDDWTAGGQVLSPAFHILRGAMERADDQPVIAAERVLLADIHQYRCMRCA